MDLVAQPPPAVGFSIFLPHGPISLKLMERSPPPRKPILACMGKEALAALVFDFGLSQIPSTKYQEPSFASS
jgi:hypothetical protein